MIAEGFQRLEQRLEKYADRAERPQHLIRDLHELRVQAGRLLFQAVDLGAFPESRAKQNGGWWDATIGRRPGGPVTRDADGAPIPTDKLTPEQFHLAWEFAHGSWLYEAFPGKFRHNAKEKGWVHPARDASGNPLRGEDGKWVAVEAQGDEADALKLLREQAEVSADACRVVVDLLPSPIQYLADQLGAVIQAAHLLNVARGGLDIGAQLRDQKRVEAALDEMEHRRGQLEEALRAAQEANVGIDALVYTAMGTALGQWSRELNGSLRRIGSIVVTSGGRIPTKDQQATAFWTEWKAVNAKRRELLDLDPASIAVPGVDLTEVKGPNRLATERPTAEEHPKVSDRPATEEPTAEEHPKVPAKRPGQKAWMAWRLREILGITNQMEIAAKMTEEGFPAHQGQVSRWLREVDAFLASGGQPPALPNPSKPVPIDPSVIEMGERRDRKARHQRKRPSDDE